MQISTTAKYSDEAKDLKITFFALLKAVRQQNIGKVGTFGFLHFSSVKILQMSCTKNINNYIIIK